MLSTPGFVTERSGLPAGRTDTALHQGLWERICPFIGRIEAGAGVILTIASIYLHVLQSRSAGGLWRDEAVTAQIAGLPALTQVWRYLEFESFPGLFPMLLRGWGWAFGAGDGSLRMLGLLVGLWLLGALWTGGRALGMRAPLFALALVGLNPMVIRYGDSMRAYGLGCALAVWACAAVWKATSCERLDWRRIAWAAGGALLSVQCLYHNATLLAAVCFSAAGVALWQGRLKAAAAALLIALPAAVSLAPYLSVIARARTWNVLLQFPLTPGFLWDRLTEVTGAPDPLGVWLWSILGIAGVAFAAWHWRHGRKTDSGAGRQLFAAGALVSGVLIYGGFLMVVGYVTHPWYYLAFLALAAVCLDAIFGQASEAPGWRLARLAVTLLFAITAFAQSAEALRVRSTNIDLVAARLNADAAPGDLVLVNQWECAISLNRYYHGNARMMTVPPVEDHLVHRFDVIQRDMQAADPLRPAFTAIEAALRGGGRVWLIGRPLLPETGQTPPSLPPLAKPAENVWPYRAFLTGWTMQADAFLDSHALQNAEVDIPAGQPINPFENQPLRCYSGWR